MEEGEVVYICFFLEFHFYLISKWHLLKSTKLHANGNSEDEQYCLDHIAVETWIDNSDEWSIFNQDVTQKT